MTIFAFIFISMATSATACAGQPFRATSSAATTHAGQPPLVVNTAVASGVGKPPLVSKQPVTNRRRVKPQKELSQILQSYQKFPAYQFKLKKTVHISLMEETKESFGRLTLSKNQLRMELEKPDPLTMVYDGKFIWLENSFKGKKQVSKIKATSWQKQTNVALSLLSSPDKIWKNFRLKSSHKEKSQKIFTLIPTRENDEITKLELVIDIKTKKIIAISYEDSIENKTSYELSKKKALKKVNKKIFQYQPPKGVEVQTF